MISLRFNPEAVIDRILQPLFAPKVVLRGLDAHMTEQELDLLKLSARDVTKTRTRSAIVRRQLGYSCLGSTLPDHTRDDPLGDSCPPDRSPLIHATKDSPTG